MGLIKYHNQRKNRKEENAAALSPQEVWDRLCSRMGNLGTYRLYQINGQRKFFDPLDDSPPVGEGCEVFIGRIPKDLFEDELVPLFAYFGPIHELRLMMNFSGLNRGFAFVMYKEPQYAEQAIRELNAFEVRQGQCIGVIQSVNNRRLYIGRLHPSGTDESDLLQLLSTLTEGLQSISVHAVKKAGEKKVVRKYAIAVYVSHRRAAMARRFLILRKNEIFPKDVIVDWAFPHIRHDKRNDKRNDGEHSPFVRENKGNPIAAAPLEAKLAEVPLPHPSPPYELQKLPKTEDRTKKQKVPRPIHVYRQLQKNEKVVGHTSSKGICSSRLTAPLYSLSPVPILNGLQHLRPPTFRVPLENGKTNRSANPSGKDEQRPKEEKGKGTRKTIPYYPPMNPCPRPGLASNPMYGIH